MTDVVLATLAVRQRALVGFPAGRDYLVFRGGAAGPVVAEIGARDGRRLRGAVDRRAPERLPSGFQNPYVDTTSDELGAEVRAVRAWDLHPVTLSQAS